MGTSFHTQLLMEQIFHGCDIGNASAEYNQYINWTTLIAE
jgi:hypothetical protein